MSTASFRADGAGRIRVEVDGEVEIWEWSTAEQRYVRTELHPVNPHAETES